MQWFLQSQLCQTSNRSHLFVLSCIGLRQVLFSFFSCTVIIIGINISLVFSLFYNIVKVFYFFYIAFFAYFALGEIKIAKSLLHLVCFSNNHWYKKYFILALIMVLQINPLYFYQFSHVAAPLEILMTSLLPPQSCCNLQGWVSLFLPDIYAML